MLKGRTFLIRSAKSVLTLKGNPYLLDLEVTFNITTSVSNLGSIERDEVVDVRRCSIEDSVKAWIRSPRVRILKSKIQNL